MFVLLNLTAPPLVLIFLPAAVLGNVTLPAPPISDVAAFNHRGEPVPTWVIKETLYLLQAGDPALVIYVPRFENATDTYRVALTAPYIVVQAPPGIMIHQITPLPERFEMNKSGIYLHFQNRVEVVYYPFALEPRPPPPPPTPTSSPTPTPPPPLPTPTPTATQRTQLPVVELTLLITAATGSAVLLLLYGRRRKSKDGGCHDLNDVDMAILRKLEEGGGSMERSELQSTLAIPKTTLHRHLHKLARYGYVRLVQEGGRQRVDLLRSC